jgi:Uma2 family endonuclease
VGELLWLPRRVSRIWKAAFALLFLLAPLERVHQLGTLYFAPFEVHLPTGDVVEPDLFFLKTENWWMRRGSQVGGAPGLAMEIVSPSSRHRDDGEKREIYQAVGVEEYWIIDVERRSIEALTLRDGRYARIPHRLARSCDRSCCSF